MLSKQNNIVVKLTYLWAFAEVALGGLLHMLHIPLTGFIVGGFAVIIIVLISKFSQYSKTTMLQALSLVLLVKFLLSPQTPYGAYIAVSFQGLLAVLLIVTTNGNKLAVFIFSFVVMLESAIQKPLIAWLVLGNNFFKAAALFIQKTFGITTHTLTNTVLYLFIFYLIIYAIWGILIAKWAIKLSQTIVKMDIDKQTIKALEKQLDEQVITGKRTFRLATFIWLFILLAGTCILLFSGFLPSTYLIRLLLVLILLFVVIPYFLRLYKKQIAQQQENKLSTFIHAMPAMKKKTQMAYLLNRPINSLQKLRTFVSTAIWLNVFYNDDENGL